MEERLIDKEDERLIRIKKKADGVDAEDVLTPEGEEDAASEEEVLVTLPEAEEGADEEYDEDLVGLTATELKRELERRKKAEEEAKAECAKLAEAAKAELADGNFEQATALYVQATYYPFVDDAILKGLWTARTKNFTDNSSFYDSDCAEEFSAASDEVKAFVREKVAETLQKERAALEKEEAELAPQVLEKQKTRQQAFEDNRKYYSLRLLIFLGLLVAFGIATGVSGYFIVRTRTNIPLIMTGVFGALALVSFVVALVYLVKFAGANKLCRENDKLSSTEEGARLVQLREHLECLKLILEDE